MPAESSARTVLEHLVGEHPGERDLWADLVSAGDVVDEHGRKITSRTPYQPTRFVYFYREPAPEIPVPHEIEILYRDDSILVIDKPHFLATIPRGAHIVESAVVRLRRDLDLPDLAPVHRLDRMTAGVIVFTVTPDLRRPYQELFCRAADRQGVRGDCGLRSGTDFPSHGAQPHQQSSRRDDGYRNRGRAEQ